MVGLWEGTIVERGPYGGAEITCKAHLSLVGDDIPGQVVGTMIYYSQDRKRVGFNQLVYLGPENDGRVKFRLQPTLESKGECLPAEITFSPSGDYEHVVKSTGRTATGKLTLSSE